MDHFVTYQKELSVQWNYLLILELIKLELDNLKELLLIADESSYVSYLEGCTAPSRDENQLHAAVVELIALDDAEIKYSTVQNWYPAIKMETAEYIILLRKEVFVMIDQKFLGLR